MQAWAAVALLAGTMPAKAGFLQDKGTTQVIQSTGISSFSRAFDGKGRLKRASAFSKTALDIFISHGLSETISLIGEVSSSRMIPRLVTATDVDSGTMWSAMGGIRARLWHNGASIVSVQALAGAGREVGRAGMMGDVRLLLGHGFDLAGYRGFADLQAGYRQTAPGSRPELRLDASFGLRLHTDVQIIGQILTAHGFSHAGQPQSLRIKTALSLVWEVSKAWSVQIGAFTTPFGFNTGQESGATLAVWRRF
jgi:hypothetical protein